MTSAVTSSAGWNSQAFEDGEHLEPVFGGKRANLEAQAAHLTPDTKNALFGVRGRPSRSCAAARTWRPSRRSRSRPSTTRSTRSQIAAAGTLAQPGAAAAAEPLGVDSRNRKKDPELSFSCFLENAYQLFLSGLPVRAGMASGEARRVGGRGRSLPRGRNGPAARRTGRASCKCPTTARPSTAARSCGCWRRPCTSSSRCRRPRCPSTLRRSWP